MVGMDSTKAPSLKPPKESMQAVWLSMPVTTACSYSAHSFAMRAAAETETLPAAKASTSSANLLPYLVSRNAGMGHFPQLRCSLIRPAFFFVFSP
jgi:hypothetical protein